ncbi:MAG: DUF350 domain-containing protein [Inquilinus sp.]|nr:DUF350 domain-containing protein [Inquilinus sp.]
MGAIFDSALIGLPVLLAHSALTLLMFVVGLAIYVWITPHREFELVRQNNAAAAVALGGAMLGLAIPLAAAMANSVQLMEIALWGGVALLLQIIAYKIVDLVLRDLSAAIERGQIAPALVLVAAKLSAALVNAAAMS